MGAKRNYSRKFRRKDDLSTQNSQKTRRTFSTGLKRAKVREIEQGLVRVTEVCRNLEVSHTSVYKWLKKYSTSYEKQIQIIVEEKSETRKLLLLKEKVAELERLVGQKQIALDHMEIMIEQASDVFGVDIKKTFGTQPSTRSGKVKKD